MTAFLRDRWDGSVKGGKRGRMNIYAQTRIAGSYGLLQMLYRTALERKYLEDISYLPENLNVTGTVMQLSISYQKRLLKEGLQISNESYGDWPQGYEMSFCTFVYAKWNWIEGYPREVVMNSRHFLPQH